MNKYLTANILAIMILTSSLASVVMIQTASAADPASWYKIKNGVLASDYYSLYPYENNSFDFGFSKYGEMISDNGAFSVGLQYPGYEVVGTYDQTVLPHSVDPFANEEVSKKLWLNGWFMEIRYTHRTRRDRTIYAMAMFADMSGFGGDWLVGHDPDFTKTPHGGRKVTTYATTDAIQTLYDGPRRYIALCVTHIYDWSDDNDDGVVNHPDETWPVVDLRITYIFEKVKKEVIILKDIKQIIQGKELDSPLDIQFSDREEWDLGPAPDWPAYAHFYHQELSTCFGPDWHLAPGIMREYVHKALGPITSVPVEDVVRSYGPPIVSGSVRVYVNGVFKEEGLDYIIDYATGGISWLITVLPTDEVEVVYKLYKGTWMGEREFVPFEGVPHVYDVAQVISADFDYVGWKAFWPTLSDYTVDGWAMSFKPLINITEPDILPFEPEIPFTIGEWDFMLGKGYPMMFRGVEVVGLTEVHDASDENVAQGFVNILDREAMYQLNEVFNPWDLNMAVHKKTARFVEFTTYIDHTGVTAPDYWETSYENVPVIVTPSQYTSYVQIGPNDYIPDPSEWDQYAVFSERIEENATGRLLVRGIDYDIYQEADGKAYIIFYVSGYFKILYSTMGMYQTTEDNADNAGIAGTPDYDLDVTLYGDDTVAPIEFYILTPYVQSWKMATLKISGWDVDYADGEFDAVYINGYYLGMLQGQDETWWTSEFDFPGSMLNTGGAQYVQIFIDCGTLDVPATIDPFDSLTWPTMGSSWEVDVDLGRIVFQYDENTPMPRYEWVTVGRDASSVDSVGSALVTATFKDKQIEIGLGALDMQGATTPYVIPNLLYKFGGGTTFQSYFKTPDTTTPGQRVALVDDWCTYWPVSSSNIIAEGGPLANWISYYFNDFTDAFYSESWFTPYSTWKDKIAAPTCWNKSAYANTATTGYATITTYLDINGTVGFMVYGLDGRDTYYASVWFHGDTARGIPPGIHQLQDAPACLTSIVLKIDYTDAKHPTFTIAECLGTISETEWTHGLEVKGGIHDP